MEATPAICSIYNPSMNSHTCIFHDLTKAKDVSSLKLQAMATQFEDLKGNLSSPSFSCYRNKGVTRDGTVTYDGCYVDTTNGELSQLSPKVSCKNLIFDF